MSRQDGKHALVVGSPSGIGFQMARAMGAKGAHVTIAGRDAAKGEQALGELRRLGSPGTITLPKQALDIPLHQALWRRAETLTGAFTSSSTEETTP